MYSTILLYYEPFLHTIKVNSFIWSVVYLHLQLGCWALNTRYKHL